jgi:glycosyltransferase involved in cell wall biosynthesis
MFVKGKLRMNSNSKTYFEDLVQAVHNRHRIPNYSEYLLFKENFNESSSDLQKSPIVFCDVTQFAKQVRITGIQRVVQSFLHLESSSFKLIVFKEGNYSYWSPNQKTTNKNVFVTTISSGKNYFKSFFLELGFKTWTNLIAPQFERESQHFNKLQAYGKGVRDRLLPNQEPSARIPILDLVGSTIFIPDLPAERKHLEALLVLAEEKLVKISFLVHDLIPITRPEIMPAGSTNEFNLYLKVLSKANSLICVSNHVAKEVEKTLKIFEESDFVTPKISINRLPVTSPKSICSDINLREKQILDDIFEQEIPFLYSVGTILVRKNYPLVVRALDILEKKGVNCNYYIFSHHNWGDESLDLVLSEERTNKVILLNDCSDNLISLISKKAKALAFPSTAEGFGLPIAEALAAGIQVIANDLPPFDEFTNHSGLLVLCEQNSALSWSREIEKVLSRNEKYKEESDLQTFDSWDEWATLVIGSLNVE